MSPRQRAKSSRVIVIARQTSQWQICAVVVSQNFGLQIRLARQCCWRRLGRKRRNYFNHVQTRSFRQAPDSQYSHRAADTAADRGSFAGRGHGYIAGVGGAGWTLAAWQPRVYSHQESVGATVRITQRRWSLLPPSPPVKSLASSGARRGRAPPSPVRLQLCGECGAGLRRTWRGGPTSTWSPASPGTCRRPARGRPRWSPCCTRPARRTQQVDRMSEGVFSKGYVCGKLNEKISKKDK